MDRNLGATKTYYTAPASGDNTADQAFGLFYQWGRKDPFPRAQGSTIDAGNASASTIPIYGPDGKTVLSEDGTGYKKVNITTGGVISGNNSLSYAISHPLTFIYGTSPMYDWYAISEGNRNDALWGDGTAKSVYDPCPEGWRVAPNGTWSDFSRATDNTQPLNGTFPYYIKGSAKEDGKSGDYGMTNGRLYKVSSSGAGTPLAWYPAAGYRYHGGGVLGSVGGSGYSWSSTVSGYSVYSLTLHAQDLSTTNVDCRAAGFQVRCIQE